MLVAPAGLEPARSCEQGILRTASGYTELPTSGISGVSATREATGSDPNGSFRDGETVETATQRATAGSIDPVETALARAVEMAAAAGEWSVVAELGEEARCAPQHARTPAVATLETERARRERQK